MLNAEELKKFSQTTLKSETATAEEKKAARKAIRRINAQTALAQGRPKRPQRRDYESDEEHQLALRDFRSFLDKAAVVREASKILDDPESSVYMRRKARETLYGPDPAEPVKTPDSQTPEKPPRSRLSPNELSEEQARAKAFLDSIGTDFIRDDAPTRPVPQSVATKPPVTPPLDPALFCERCRVPFKVCGCDKLTCPICWHPKANCYAPCPNARVRN
jgi:hypothetical protein